MMALDVSRETISHALHRFGANTGGGFVNQHDREYVIRNVSRTRKLDDLRALVIAERDGVSIALSQVADVAFEPRVKRGDAGYRSEEHTSELQSLMRISYAVFCFKKK